MRSFRGQGQRGVVVRVPLMVVGVEVAVVEVETARVVLVVLLVVMASGSGVLAAAVTVYDPEAAGRSGWSPRCLPRSLSEAPLGSLLNGSLNLVEDVLQTCQGLEFVRARSRPCHAVGPAPRALLLAPRSGCPNSRSHGAMLGVK
jgi:hypothetical protein